MQSSAPVSVIHTDITATLSNCALFRGLSDSQRTDLMQQASIVHAAKGKTLYVHQEEASSFYIVSQGWIKLFRETLDGNEAVIDILNDGHIFGETSMFGNGSYSSSAQAVEDTTLIRLPISSLRQIIEAEPKVALNLLDSMSRFRQQQERELEHRSLQNAPQRIGCFLLRLCGTEMPDEVTLHLPYDKTLLAARLGMKPETFSRALAKLRSETGISINGAAIHISNVRHLVEYSCSACSQSFPCEDAGC